MTVKQSLLRGWSGQLNRAARVFGLMVAVGFLAAGCDRAGAGLNTAEIDEFQFRRGQQALRGGQNAEALQAFLNVIDKRNGEAPESHLESGRLYLTHLKDPFTAIYHFNKYLELNPNGLSAEGVREQIKTAQKAIFQNIAGQTMGDQVDRLDMIDKIENQRAEIASLRAELHRLSQARQTPSTVVQSGPPRPPSAAPPVTMRPAAPPVEEVAPVIQPIETAFVPPNGVRTNPTRPDGAPPPTPSGRTYVVQQGETLSAISRKFYGNPSQWRVIYELNRDRVPNPNVLKPGTEIRLP